MVARMAAECPLSLRFHRRLIMPSSDSEDEDDDVEPAVRGGGKEQTK